MKTTFECSGCKQKQLTKKFSKKHEKHVGKTKNERNK